MSSRRSRSRQSGASAEITDAQITDLVSKLQQLIPELRARLSDKVFITLFLIHSLTHIALFLWMDGWMPFVFLDNSQLRFPPLAPIIQPINYISYSYNNIFHCNVAYYNTEFTV